MKVYLILVISFILTGCASKEKVIYKDILIPTKCDAKMPLKPANNGDFESHKAKMIYYMECENTLKFCLGIKDD
ncbi:hypothetical protein IMC76_08670 [Campylobacter corcagiensis]|uniref:Lipoprotein n=1 Tax=Campylobacter corcagiensis TaxID=1448857 RepID=A0A7M1LK68_9BACT|nr:hypothetical protein IMC76_08670 [Campylobacter corcagiensis]